MVCYCVDVRKVDSFVEKFYFFFKEWIFKVFRRYGLGLLLISWIYVIIINWFLK